MYEKISLPNENKDIIASIRKRCIKNIVYSLIWYIGGYVFYKQCIDYYYADLVKQSLVNRPIVIYGILTVYILLPFFAFKLKEVVFDWSWSGVITNKKYKIVYDIDIYKYVRSPGIVGQKVHAKQMQQLDKEIVILTIKKSNGRTIKRTFKDDDYILGDKYYHVNDEIIYYKGVKYPKKKYNYNLNEFENLCFVCGYDNIDNHKEKCNNCHHTIMK